MKPKTMRYKLTKSLTDMILQAITNVLYDLFYEGGESNFKVVDLVNRTHNYKKFIGKKFLKVVT